jgi:hypothetical protein
VTTRQVVAICGRAGYAARALLYAWLGALACWRAVSDSGRPDFAGTFVSMHRPLWSRSDIAVRGAMHLWLAMTAVRLAVMQSIDSRPVRRWVTLTLATTSVFGTAIVLAVGVGLLWFSWNELMLARRGQITAHFDDRRPPDERRVVTCLVASAGMAGRATAFGLMAIAVIGASVAGSATAAVDLADVLQHLCSTGAGRLLVLATGACLWAYGAYLAILVWNRRMPT